MGPFQVVHDAVQAALRRRDRGCCLEDPVGAVEKRLRPVVRLLLDAVEGDMGAFEQLADERARGWAEDPGTHTFTAASFESWCRRAANGRAGWTKRDGPKPAAAASSPHLRPKAPVRVVEHGDRPIDLDPRIAAMGRRGVEELAVDAETQRQEATNG